MVTSISNPLITLAVFNVVVVIFLAAGGRPPSIGAVALFFAYSVALVTIVIGFSLASSVLFLRYQDLNQVWEVVAQASSFWRRSSPLGIVPERLHFYFYLWPPTPVAVLPRRARPRARADANRAHICD